MISEVMPILSESGLQKLEQNFDKFLKAVSQKVQVSNATWQAILRCYLFQEEAQSILTHLNQRKELSLEKKREVMLAIQMNECQFDLETVEEYLGVQRNNSVLDSDPDDNFQHYIWQNSRARVEEQYKSLFDEMIDQAKVQQ